MTPAISPEAWGLHAVPGGELSLGNHTLSGLAHAYGTPLHVVHESRLARSAASFLCAVKGAYRGSSSVHYAMKCNSVPAVVSTVLRAGAGLEVMTEYELGLALHLGCDPSRIIVNGPCKNPHFLDACLGARVRLIIVDSVAELRMLGERARSMGVRGDILLRVNPDYTPQGMNGGSATGSRKGCALGLDLKGGEVREALSMCRDLAGIHCTGFHLHIGTGIRNPEDYSRALRCVGGLRHTAEEFGHRVRVIDAGGGFASPSTRELDAKELLLYQALGRLPHSRREKKCGTPAEFASAIARAVSGYFGPGELPELIVEPGRCIASAAQALLLTVHYVKERPGAGRWLVADGGLSTVTLPTFYEYHEVFLCNDPFRAPLTRATIVGPACFAGDVVYRNKPMPEVRPGEVIAIMDSGAYFTAMESSFGFPRPAIVAVNGASCRIVRTRETFGEMSGRDVLD